MISPAPGESDPQASVSSAGAIDAPLSRSFVCFCVCCRVTGTLGRVASWTFCWEGVRVAPSGPFFHMHVFPFPRSLFLHLSLFLLIVHSTGGGNAVRFSDFCFGWVLPLPLRSLLRDAFPRKFSPANFWFRAFVSSRVFWCCFAYVFLIAWDCSPESCLKQCSSCQVRVSRTIFGSELLVLAFCVRSVFFGGVLPMFLVYCAGTFSRKLPVKFFSCQVRVSRTIFGSELLVLAFCVRSVFFAGVSPMFLLYCAGTFSRKLPEIFLLFSSLFFSFFFFSSLSFSSLHFLFSSFFLSFLLFSSLFFSFFSFFLSGMHLDCAIFLTCENLFG